MANWSPIWKLPLLRADRARDVRAASFTAPTARTRGNGNPSQQPFFKNVRKAVVA